MRHSRQRQHRLRVRSAALHELPLSNTAGGAQQPLEHQVILIFRKSRAIWTNNIVKEQAGDHTSKSEDGFSVRGDILLAIHTKFTRYPACFQESNSLGSSPNTSPALSQSRSYVNSNCLRTCPSRRGEPPALPAVPRRGRPFSGSK